MVVDCAAGWWLVSCGFMLMDWFGERDLVAY